MIELVALTYYTATLNVDVTFCGLPYGTPGIAWPFDVAGGQCGDIIRIEADGQVFHWPAIDSGAFGRHCVRQLDGSCPRIGADIPEFLWWKHPRLSTLGTVVNLSERARHEEYPQ